MALMPESLKNATKNASKTGTANNRVQNEPCDERPAEALRIRSASAHISTSDTSRDIYRRIAKFRGAVMPFPQ